MKNARLSRTRNYGIDTTQNFDRALADLIGSRPNGIKRRDVEQFGNDWLTAKLVEWQIKNLIQVWTYSDSEEQDLSGFSAAYKEHSGSKGI